MDLNELQRELSRALQQLSQQYEAQLRDIQAQVESLNVQLTQLTQPPQHSGSGCTATLSTVNVWQRVQQGRHGKTACASCRHGLWCQNAYDSENMRFQCLISGITDPATTCTQQESLA